MADCAGASLTQEEKDVLKWISEHYLRSVYTLMDSNRVYLNQGITWSIGIISAVIIFGLTYISPLQEIKNPAGSVVERNISAIPNNITEADILLLTTVLSLSIAFVSNFLSRSIKGYLNLMRYVGLYNCCLRLASNKEKTKTDALNKTIDNIIKFDAGLFPPLTLTTTIWKMIFELGYGLFFVIQGILLAGAAAAWVSTPTSVHSVFFWLLFSSGPVWFILELVFLRFRSSYFRYNGQPAINWSDVQNLK